MALASHLPCFDCLACLACLDKHGVTPHPRRLSACTRYRPAPRSRKLASPSLAPRSPCLSPLRLRLHRLPAPPVTLCLSLSSLPCYAAFRAHTAPTFDSAHSPSNAIYSQAIKTIPSWPLLHPFSQSKSPTHHNCLLYSKMSSPYSPSEEKVKADSYKGDVVATLEDGVGRDDVNAFDQRKGEELKHALLPRHMAMISIGGVIGTGLFLGTASSLHNAGPLGLWLGYLVMGSVCYAMMMCLGEMISYLPFPVVTSSSASVLSASLFFAMGWNYWYNWVIVLPAELSAAAVLMSYWSDANPAIWISVFLVVVVAINLLGTRAYGEAEFWFASIKIITIVGLIILSICIDLGVGKQGRLGFRYWKNPGPFVQYNKIEGSLGRFLGFFSVLVNAAFSFIGTEIVAIASAEAKNPRKSVPAPSARFGSVSASSTSSAPS